MGTLEADLMVHGIASARAGERKEAVYYLEWLLRLNPNQDQRSEALYWLSEVAETPAEAREFLENLLAVDPFDLRARRKLGILDGKIQPNPGFNPDTYRQPVAENPQSSESRRHTCPQCGGKLTFSADGSSLICEFCEARQSLKPSNSAEANRANDFLAAMVSGRGHWRPQSELEFHCQGCGAIISLPPAQMSANCPYCGSAHTTQEPAQEYILPNLVVPFTISAATAKEGMRTWLQANFPQEWPKLGRGVGAYLPAWIFHVVGILPWSCEVKRQREWVPEKGDQIVDIPDLRIPGTQRLGALWGQALAGYDLAQAQTFAEGFLANWPAETYQVELGDASLEARKQAKEQMRQRVDDRILEQHRNLVVNSTDLMIESFQLVLLPAWLTNYTTPEGQRVEVLLNGQSGQVLTG